MMRLMNNLFLLHFIDKHFYVTPLTEEFNQSGLAPTIPYQSWTEAQDFLLKQGVSEVDLDTAKRTLLAGSGVLSYMFVV